MDADGRSGGRPQTGSTSGGSSDDTAANQHPKVVLVTGACRFLGGYLTARLAQNPAIDHVIAVDAVTPSKDLQRRMGRAEFVRADIRNPFIAKVIRNGDVDTVVHASAASYAPRSGGRVALTEQNVMGAMQLFAACQKAPSVRLATSSRCSTLLSLFTIKAVGVPLRSRVTPCCGARMASLRTPACSLA